MKNTTVTVTLIYVLWRAFGTKSRSHQVDVQKSLESGGSCIMVKPYVASRQVGRQQAAPAANAASSATAKPKTDDPQQAGAPGLHRSSPKRFVLEEGHVNLVC